MQKYCAFLGLLAACGMQAETGYDVWLRYAALDAGASRQYREVVPAAVTALGDSAIIGNAREEMIRGIRGMLNRTLRVEDSVGSEGAIVLGTLNEIRKAAPQFSLDGTVGAEGFWLKATSVEGKRYLIVAGTDERGVLYGSFTLLRKIALGESITNLDEKQAPSVPFCT